jgi:hypothetical protein
MNVSLSCEIQKTEFLFNKTNRRTNFLNLFLSRNYMFRAVPMPIVRSFPLYVQHWCTFSTGVCHAGLLTAFKHDQDGRA